MKKIFSLVNATMSEGMNIFKVSTKKNSSFVKYVLPIILALWLMGAMYIYSEMVIKELKIVNMEFVLLTLFVIITSLITLIEGIYKSSNLLFNCKDDNLLLSLPIRKSTVLFMRVFKFYLFELLYNSLFLLPAIVAYAKYMNPSFTYYIVSFVGLLVFPIIPILVSCVFGTLTSYISSKFKGKSIVQTLITVIFLLGIIYFSYNSDGLIMNISQNASSINDMLTKLYYPAGAYVELITKFNVLKLLEFILIHIVLFIISIMIIGKFYFSVNSNVKSITANKVVKNYKIKTAKPIKSLINKEFNRFINSTVFITNAGMGLILFIVGIVLVSVKFDNIVETMAINNPSMTSEYLINCMPVILFGFICMTSFMSSITSSMISLEGKSFAILKSLPIRPYTIVKSKILTAVLIMLPFIVIGNLIIFIRFKFSLLSMFLILIASILFPLVAETIGIMVNLKYPRMDAKNDTEVVKQSMSSAISVFIGIIMSGITILFLLIALSQKIQNNIIIITSLIVYLFIYLGLHILLRKTCDKIFENILV